MRAASLPKIVRRRSGVHGYGVFAAEAIAIVKEPDVIKQLAVVGVDPMGGGPAEFDLALKGEIDRVAKVVKAAGIKLA